MGDDYVDEVDFAKKFLEDLLSFFGLNTDIRATKEDEVIELSVPSTHLNGFLIGQRGETLRSIQFLVSSALKNNDYGHASINIDVADYKRHRRDRLAEKVAEWIAEVKKSGKARSLQPMNPADRRVVHRTVNESSGVVSESAGEGRDRRVVISPTKNENEDQ